MRDVAAEAGVSFKTVSRVVNVEGGVSDELVGRVERAIAVLGYRRDERARHLRRDSTRTGAIGFVHVDVSNPFFSMMLRGIEEVARDADSIVMSGSAYGEEERETQLVEAFLDRRVDGLIVVPEGTRDATLRQEINRGTPVVFVDLEPPEGLLSDVVRTDHLHGARQATAHLVAHGHGDIAFFGDVPRVTSAALRRRGYEEALAAGGVPLDTTRIVHGRHRPEVWRELIRDSLSTEDPPSAIFTAQNFVTVGGAQALHDLGLHRTIAQVGFDEVVLGDTVDPGLTVVPQDPRELGRRAASILFERMGGRQTPPARHILPTTLVERGSGELLP